MKRFLQNSGYACGSEEKPARPARGVVCGRGSRSLFASFMSCITHSGGPAAVVALPRTSLRALPRAFGSIGVRVKWPILRGFTVLVVAPPGCAPTLDSAAAPLHAVSEIAIATPRQRAPCPPGSTRQQDVCVRSVNESDPSLPP